MQPQCFEAYGEDHLDHARILALADKVEGQADAGIEAHYPEHMGAAVELTLANGSVRRAKVMDSRGTAAHPLDNDAIEAKAAGLAHAAAPDFDMAAARRDIWNDDAADSTLLVRLFAS